MRRIAIRARTLWAVLLLAGAPGAAMAQDGSSPGDVAQDLYQNALQSIAEGRKNDASATLRQVIDKEPLHAGAWLDLALIQCGLGHKQEAEQLFTSIINRFAPPPGILSLIAEARRGGCVNWTAVSQYNISIGRGVDQNVNQGASRGVGVDTEYELTPEFQPHHDQYTVLSGDYTRDLTPNGTIGFVQFQGRRNDHLHDYDSASLFSGVDVPWRRGAWTLRGSALVGFITLGGKYYQRQYQGQLRLGPPLPLPFGIQFTVQTGLTRLEYMTLSNFDSTTGEVRAQMSRRDGDSLLSASFGMLNDRAVAARPGGNRHGQSAALQWRRAFANHLSTDIGYNWQAWHSANAYAPGIIDQVRDQGTHVWRAALNYPLSKNQNLQLEARQVRNQENISIFQYNNRQLQLSWQWQGP